MMKKYLWASACLILSAVLLFPQNKEQQTLELTLEQCIRRTLDNNLDIQVQAFEPEISGAALVLEKEKYWPRLSFNYNNYRYNQLSNWAVEGSNYIQKVNQMEMEIQQDIFTGGRFSFGLLNSVTDTTRSLSIINPSYRGQMRLGFTQPLLRNFGPKMMNKDIRQAENQWDITVSGLKSTIMQKVYEAEEAYWNLFYARRNLEVLVNSLRKSQRRLEELKKAARIGIKSELDVLQAETEMANRETSVLSARLQVDTQQNRLYTLLNLEEHGGSQALRIIPVDEPVLEKVTMNFEEALQTAMANNPEIIRIQKEKANSEMDVSFYRNQLLPQLDLQTSIWFPGQSGDRLIYKDNNPYTGIIVDKIEGSRWGSLEDVFNFEYTNWSVALTLDVPLQDVFSRAALARAQLQSDKTHAELERAEKSVANELKAVFKEIINREKQIELAKRYRELMEKKLAAEQEKYNLGLVGSEWLYQYERELDSARSNEIRAVIDYRISVSRLEQIIGTNLRNKNIRYLD